MTNQIRGLKISVRLYILLCNCICVCMYIRKVLATFVLQVGLGLMQFIVQNNIWTYYKFPNSFWHHLYSILSVIIFCFSDMKKYSVLFRHVTSSLQAVKSLFEPYCCDVVGEFDDVIQEPGDRQKMLWSRRTLRTRLGGALVLRVPECEVWSWILTSVCQEVTYPAAQGHCSVPVRRVAN